MKNTYRFPAIFTPEERGVSIEFPDLPGCLPCADDLDEAFENAKEALGLHLYCMEEDNEVIPEASSVSDLEVPDGGILTMIDVFMPVYREKIRKSTVKKTLTIPYWLNAEAEHLGVNFSQVLTDALKQQIEAPRT